MTIPIFVVFITIFTLTSFVIGKTIYYRNDISSMPGMMIAMALGMTVGLVIGVIVGILFTGNLFNSTVIGITVGMTAGFLAGIPTSMIAVLDGMLAGIMGGMMGAMLGDMILVENRDAIVKIMFMLFIATILILLYIIQEEITSNRTLLKNLFIITILFLIFLVGFNLFGPIFPETDIQHNHGSSYY